MRSLSPTNEVRRCSRCGQPALTCVYDWQHQVLGKAVPIHTLELECQACGVKLTLHPRTKINAARILAYLMIPAVFPSIVFFARARRMERDWRDNPVVAGVTEPAKRSAVGARVELPRVSRLPGDRACRCGSAAPCVQLRQRRYLGTPVGVRQEYACARCSSVFHVYDRVGIIFLGIRTLVFTALGALIVAFPPGSGVGAEHSNRWFGVALLVVGAVGLVQLVSSIHARLNHPIAQ